MRAVKACKNSKQYIWKVGLFTIYSSTFFCDYLFSNALLTTSCTPAEEKVVVLTEDLEKLCEIYLGTVTLSIFSEIRNLHRKSHGLYVQSLHRDVHHLCQARVNCDL